MSHKYANFNDAFNDFTNKFLDIQTNLNSSLINAKASYSGASDPVDKLHFGFLEYAVELIITAMRQLGDYTATAWDRSYFYESIYWSAQPTATYELTMLKIIDAMVSSTSDELETFICIEDAFRASIWNKPFNYEWYAGMVRAFKSWQ
jgi:hypothetical protein